jgi:hypothetical protein
MQIRFFFNLNRDRRVLPGLPLPYSRFPAPASFGSSLRGSIDRTASPRKQ